MLIGTDLCSWPWVRGTNLLLLMGQFPNQRLLHLSTILGVDVTTWFFHGWWIPLAKTFKQVWGISTLPKNYGLICKIISLKEVHLGSISCRRKFRILYKVNYRWVLISQSSKHSGMNLLVINLMLLAPVFVLVDLIKLKLKLNKKSIFFIFLWDWMIVLIILLVKSWLLSLFLPSTKFVFWFYKKKNKEM